MTPGPGWYRDPYFLHHERYLDNGWTDYVRRVQVQQPALGAQPVRPALARDAGDTARLGRPLPLLPPRGWLRTVEPVVGTPPLCPIAGSPGSGPEVPGEQPNGDRPPCTTTTR